MAAVQVGADRAQQPCAGPYPTVLHIAASGAVGLGGTNHHTFLFTAWLFRNIQIILSSKKYTWVSPGHLGGALIAVLGECCHLHGFFLKPLRRLCDIPHRSYPANSVPHPANTVFGSCHRDVHQGVILLAMEISL